MNLSGELSISVRTLEIIGSLHCFLNRFESQGHCVDRHSKNARVSCAYLDFDELFEIVERIRLGFPARLLRSFEHVDDFVGVLF